MWNFEKIDFYWVKIYFRYLKMKCKRFDTWKYFILKVGAFCVEHLRE